MSRVENLVEEAIMWLNSDGKKYLDKDIIDVMTNALAIFCPRCLSCKHIGNETEYVCEVGHKVFDKRYGWECEDFTKSGGDIHGKFRT